MKKFVSYLRVSTSKQGINGLGIEGQRESIKKYLNGGEWNIVKEFVEVESGKNNDRKELKRAVAFCKNTGSTLVIAKLDRLSRSVSFISTLMDTDIDFICCDFPEANRLTIHILAAVAENERVMISSRTKNALQILKDKGVKLGNPNLTDEIREKGRKRAKEVMNKNSLKFAQSIYGVIHPMVLQGHTLRKIAEFLNDEGYMTSRKGEFRANTVKRVIDKVNNIV
jgi:DNA invertase Pin-like site-specific DNA recombinase